MGDPSVEYNREEESVEGRFRRFHEEHPIIMAMFQDYALRLKKVGHKHWSADRIFHTFETLLALETTGKIFIEWPAFGPGLFEVPHVNDHYKGMYARYLMEIDERLVEFFPIQVKRAQ